MTKYIKKSVLVDAWQWDGTKGKDQTTWPLWLKDLYKENCVGFFGTLDKPTIEIGRYDDLSLFVGYIGDYIVKEPGEPVYILGSDEFKKRFENIS